MDKKILMDYIDACKLIDETEQDIRKLRKKMTFVQTNVKSTMQCFPNVEQHLQIEGATFTYEDDKQLRIEEENLIKQKAKAEEIKVQAESFMCGIPARMQRIIRFKYKQRPKNTWDDVARLMDEGLSGDAYRKQLKDFLENE